MKESPGKLENPRQNDGAFELCFELSIDQWKNPGTSHENPLQTWRFHGNIIDFNG